MQSFRSIPAVGGEGMGYSVGRVPAVGGKGMGYTLSGVPAIWRKGLGLKRVAVEASRRRGSLSELEDLRADFTLRAGVVVFNA